LKKLRKIILKTNKSPLAQGVPHKLKDPIKLHYTNKLHKQQKNKIKRRPLSTTKDLAFKQGNQN